MPAAHRPLVIAHRGVHGVAGPRENTLPAVTAAVAAGADAIEIDVRMAADGTLVVVHDETFERLWGDPRPVSATTWDEIARLGDGEARVPRLEELLELSLAHDVPLVLDQKEPHVGVAAARLVGRTPGADRTAFCGSTEGLVAIRELHPGATLHLTDTGPGVPDIRVLATVRPQYHNPRWDLLSRATVEAMRWFGVRTCCWTPSTQAALGLVRDLGVDAVMTDEVALAQRVVVAATAAPAGVR